ncbi:MAG: electron transport complex subunit RsxC, partial [Clostridia bacterium]|nr:electron transport complex subunit RsxC [Clostridia bacterium]
MAFYLHGIRLPHRKHTGKKAVASMPPPASVTIPLSMHIGAPAPPIVKVGDEVRVGTKIGEAAGKVSSPIYSSVSGKV